ncbi:MAG: hypothetical protein WCE62_13635 [Polyangiales bacterium]
MRRARFWVMLLLVVTFTANADADDAAAEQGQPQFGVMPMAPEASVRRLERRLSQQGRPKEDRRQTRPAPEQLAVAAVHQREFFVAVVATGRAYGLRRVRVLDGDGFRCWSGS